MMGQVLLTQHTLLSNMGQLPFWKEKHTKRERENRVHSSFIWCAIRDILKSICRVKKKSLKDDEDIILEVNVPNI